MVLVAYSYVALVYGLAPVHWEDSEVVWLAFPSDFHLVSVAVPHCDCILESKYPID